MISEWIGCDRVGSIIEGRFPLQRWLGGAGESGVFLTQVGGASPRNAAIKIVPAGIADAESLLDQWMKAKRRVHPHLIQLFHAGYCRMDDCDLLYAVTDRADEILADVLPVRALTPAEVREMLDSLLETLTWLHGQGLVHGSLKPSNIMVVNERIRISVDRIQPAGPRMFPVLSPGIYEAPESALKIAPAADLWSLGVLLVEALTQKPPLWYGTGPRIPASVPQPFAEIASECLRLDPARRCTLREIRSHLAPAPRTVAVPAAPKAPAAEGARTSASPAVVAPPAPAFKAPDSAEPSRALLAQLALAHVAQAQPPMDLAPDPSAGPFANPISPPPAAGTAPPDVPSAGTAALEPALPVVSPAISQTPRPDLQPHPAAIAPAAETAKPDPAPPVAEALLADPPAEAPPEIAPKNPEAAPEPPGIAPEPQAVAPEPSATAPEPPAIAPEPLAPEPSALKTPEKPLAAAPAPDAHTQLPEAAAQRRVNNPSAEPVQSAERPRANRLATLIAFAMVVIAAGLMLLLALHVSSSSAAAPAVATNQSPIPAPPAGPLPKAATPPASAATSTSPAPATPTSTLPAPAAPTLPSPAANAPSPLKPNSPKPVPAPPPAASGATTSGAVVQRVLPHVTQRALDTLRGRMVVIVRVQVDAGGNVTDATYDYEGTSHYLKTAALNAANNWKFKPPQIGGRPVPSTWNLQFWFDQSGPSVIAIEKNSQRTAAPKL